MDRKKIIITGNKNSAEDKPSQIILRALPLLSLKYLDIEVVAVCAMRPCPANLKKKIPTNKKIILLINEKNNAAKDKNITTKIEKFTSFISSIFFPTQIKAKLLHKVAIAYRFPKSPCEIFNSSLML